MALVWPGRKRLPKKPQLRIFSEHSEQVALFQWAYSSEHKYPELALLFAIPNGAKLPWIRNKKGHRFSSEAMRLKAEGLKSGVPDIMLPVARLNYCGLFIEMKIKGNKPTDNQMRWHLLLEGQRYRVVVCYGFEEAKNALLTYLYL